MEIPQSTASIATVYTHCKAVPLGHIGRGNQRQLDGGRVCGEVGERRREWRESLQLESILILVRVGTTGGSHEIIEGQTSVCVCVCVCVCGCVCVCVQSTGLPDQLRIMETAVMMNFMQNQQALYRQLPTLIGICIHTSSLTHQVPPSHLPQSTCPPH